MLKFKAILVAFVVLLFLSACGKDAVQDDLISYINGEQMKKVAADEKIAFDAYANVSGKNYTNDETMYKVLNEKVIPTYQKVITEIKSIKPQTEELRNIHELYIAGAESQYNAYTQLEAALEQGDKNLVTQANEKSDEGKKKISEYNDKIEKLAKEHNVTITPKN